MLGRRDNIYKARIKILVNDLGIDKFKKLVDEHYLKFLNKKLELDFETLKNIYTFFKLPKLRPNKGEILQINDKEFSQWVNQNIMNHKIPGYSIITISLKSP